ncbi:endo-1,4-beta-xylanase [Anaerophaga thermohalophila]|uniref:endo-1,4-beta-xylanase n=1 Tax=Anaerophaga thermohalophila TaxID=177400 RepID=UPI00036E0FC1|nr:endo-1,4-beta-xylanase [Anaerophaga thermohalophila]
MKLLNKYWQYTIALLLLASCADNSMLEYDVAKPKSIAEKEYLKEYDVLKSYVDRNKNPDFKLGAGVSASGYSEKGALYSLVNSNFDEITAGNAMKYGSVVQDDGSMDFSQVVQFVSAAKEANTEIYGHTLVWHAQQNKKYLESIIADKELDIDPDATVEVVDGTEDYLGGAYTFWSSSYVDPVVENEILVVTNEEATPNFWDVQFHIADGIPTKVGTKYKVTLRIKGSTPGDITLVMGDWGGQENTTISFTEEWQEVTAELTGTAESSFVMLQSGHYVGTYEIDWVEVTHEEAAAISWWTNLVTNSDVESDDLSCFFATEMTDGPKTATVGAPGTGADGVGRAIVVQSGDNPTNPWDTQFFVRVPHVFKEGEKYRFSMKIRAEKPAPSESQAHAEPGQYLIWYMVGSPNFTTEWQEYSYSGTIDAAQDGMSTIAFNLAVFDEANTYYFDDIYFEIEESGNKIPLTDEEKADTLTYALDKWIAGMMEATDGYVKSWDVVNEPISGADNDGDGYYDLQSADTGDPENNFYWQDYLGDNYVRTAVELAREYGPDDMKLFVNDYNLESDWDDNQKLKSLIHWIEQWESDGETVIDGIGTQMHVSYHMNPETQASKEEHIVQMYELLAETGKLVKITELDMGLVDENGDAVMIDDGVTQEQHMAMAEFYNFIIRKYFEIIPANQRYGIAHWSPADPPSSSSWRGGEPIGLWTEDFDYRKHTYAGFAEGLAGEEFVETE